MKKILFILGLTILLVGCAQGESLSITKAFKGGTEAIDFDFLEETPPAEVFDAGQQPFEVALSLENKGEFDVALNDVKIKLSGFFPGDFNNPVIEKNPDENLDKSYVDPDGDIQRGTITFVNFPGFNFGGTLVGNNRYTIRADICYKYGTNAQADLCILEDLTPTEKEVCEVNEKKSVDVSSAPVQIENFDQEVAGTRKIKFSFDIVQRGTGLVSKLATDCSTELGDKNRVWIEIDVGVGSLSCSGLEGGTTTTGRTILYSGKRKVICTLDISGVSGDFIKKVNVKLTYDYKEHKQTDILVKHATG